MRKSSATAARKWIAAIGCLLGLSAQAAPLYDLTVLPRNFDNRDRTFVTSVNDEGSVTMTVFRNGATTSEYWAWSAADGYVKLPGPAMLNDHGDLVGSNRRFVFARSPTGPIVKTPAPRGTRGVAIASINDDGTAVGAVYNRPDANGSSNPQAFVRSRDGTVTIDAAHPLSQNLFVNTSGAYVEDVFEDCFEGCTVDSVRYVDHGVDRHVITPTGGRPEAVGLDDDGRVAITSDPVGYWSADEGFVPIGVDGVVAGIAAGGVIAGNGVPNGQPVTATPFVWTRNEGYRRLQDLVAPRASRMADMNVAAVSRHGTIAGESINDVLVLTPVAAP